MGRHIRGVSWPAVALALLGHLLLTWALLVIADESKLVGVDTFAYYYSATAAAAVTTIGSGDLTPQTPFGRMGAVFLLMPGPVVFFAAVLTQTSVGLSAYWRRHREGRMRHEQMEGHTVPVRWRGAESDWLVDLMLSDVGTDDGGVVVVAEAPMENHRPGQMRPVAIGTYADAPSFARAAVARRRRIIVNARTDEPTLVAVLAVMARTRRSRMRSRTLNARPP